jgi:hypothetical protein
MQLHAGAPRRVVLPICDGLGPRRGGRRLVHRIPSIRVRFPCNAERPRCYHRPARPLQDDPERHGPAWRRGPLRRGRARARPHMPPRQARERPIRARACSRARSYTARRRALKTHSCERERAHSTAHRRYVGLTGPHLRQDRLPRHVMLHAACCCRAVPCQPVGRVRHSRDARQARATQA